MLLHEPGPEFDNNSPTIVLAKYNSLNKRVCQMKSWKIKDGFILLWKKKGLTNEVGVGVVGRKIKGGQVSH